MLHEKHLAWLTARGFERELIEEFGLSTTSDGAGNWLTVPYMEHGRLLNHKYRQTREKRHRMDTGAPLCLWNHDTLLVSVRSGPPCG